MIQNKSTSPFQSGQNSSAKGDPAEKVPVKSKGSMMKMGGVKDPLRQALSSAKKDSGNRESFFHSRVSKPTGARYEPRGNFGRMKK